MKNNLFIGLFLMIIILNSLNLVNAGLSKGNSSGEIESTYSSGGSIRGWINISVDRISNDSFLTSSFNASSTLTTNTKIRELIDFSGVSIECVPNDCSANITLKDESTSKSVALNTRDTALLGIKIPPASEIINSVEAISFNVQSTAADSCSIPFKIDIMNDGGGADYVMENLSNEFCPITNPYGCFNPSDSNGYVNLTKSESDGGDSERNYCQNISVPPYKFFRVGANISAPSGATFNEEITMTMDVGGGAIPCTASITNTQLSCNMTVELESGVIARVCIKPQANTPYQLKYEITNPCGSLIDEYGNHNLKDFEIFAYPLKYKNVGQIKVNRTDLATSISDDLRIRYGDGVSSSANCSSGCVIPINISAGINQTITISDVALVYRKGGNRQTSNIIGNVSISSPIITILNGFKRLNLDLANIPVPRTAGTYKYFLKYGTTPIINATIYVGDAPIISDIIPHEGVALLNNTFFLLFENKTTVTANYYWKFGNSTPIITTNPQVNYKFDSTGSVTLTVTMVTNKGNSSKTTSIGVYTPNEGFNRTLKKYRESLANFTAQFNGQNVSALLRQESNGRGKAVDLTNTKEELDAKEKAYALALDSQESQRLTYMRELLAMKIPNKLIVTQIIKNSHFVQNPNRIDFADLDEFGAGSFEGEEADFGKRLNSWLNENLNVNFDSKSYEIAYLNGQREFLFSDVNFNINPKVELSQAYFVVDAEGLADKVKIGNSELRTKTSRNNNAFEVDLTTLPANQNLFIQFLYPASIDLTNLPVYISPELTAVGGTAGINPGPCNNDGECGTGETYKNCPGDCKPWGIAIILLIVLIIIAVIIYIVMQEWYKRYYESYLFTNKTQLFNLINFMYNSSNQGNTKTDVFSKLKDQGWKGEQLDYAWRKFKGERVGMWEIPIFKWAENKQVKNELIKRNPDFSKNSAMK